MPAPTESALQNVRAEWVASDQSSGTPRPPTNPSWNRFSDYIESYPGWSGDAGVEGQTPAGSGDIADHFRGAEEHGLTVQWWLQRFFVDTGGNANDPIGALMAHDYQTDFPTHEVLFRREVGSGGAVNAGFREYVYGSGCKPISGSAPGDPSASNPILAEAEYAVEKARQFIVHQPSNPTTLSISSDDAADAMSVTVESEGASTSETVTLPGTSTNVATTTASFSDIDAIWVSAAHAGDIQVSGIADPASSTTLGVKSTASGDTGIDVTIENEDGSKSETITTDGTDATTFVTGATSFSSIGKVTLSAAASGNIEVYINDAGTPGTLLGDVPSGETVQTGADLLEDPIVGSNTDGVESDRGIPLLGTGSHAAAIGTDPANYLFLGTSSTWGGGALAESAAADRVHALDLSIEADESREARQGTRRQSIDVGTRTVSVEADLAGPYESAKQNFNYFTGREADLVYGYPDGDVTVKSAQLTDTDDVERSGGDSNAIYGVTLEGHGDPAITATHS